MEGSIATDGLKLGSVCMLGGIMLGGGHAYP